MCIRDSVDTEDNIMMSSNEDGPEGADFKFTDGHVNLIRSRVKSPGIP